MLLARRVSSFGTRRGRIGPPDDMEPFDCNDAGAVDRALVARKPAAIEARDAQPPLDRIMNYMKPTTSSVGEP